MVYSFAARINYFYPRPPWGGRPIGKVVLSTIKQFLSTPSVGRTTSIKFLGVRFQRISIHALRGEDDACRHRHFPFLDISIHALRGEDDDKFFQNITFL